MDSVSELLRRVIWDRRNVFYDDAVAREIITRPQAEALMLLHLERDAAQDDREASGA